MPEQSTCSENNLNQNSVVYLCLKTEPPRPKKKPAPVYDTDGALLVTATTITIRMPICYYSDDHGPIKKIQVLVVEAGGKIL